jgi:hypothetical protein
MRINYILVLFFLILIEKIGAQDSGFVIINSQPSGARVLIDGIETGRTTSYQTQFNAGFYILELRLDGYTSFRQIIEIKPNETLPLSVRLTQNFTGLEINTTPSSATVYIDGINIGETQLINNNLTAGKHIIRIEKSMYRILLDTIELFSDSIISKEYELSAVFATIGIIVKPVDADIYIDGKWCAKKMYSGRLSNGYHIIEVKREKYNSKQKTLMVNEGDEINEEFTLAPITGRLTVMTDPPDAQITLISKNPISNETEKSDYVEYSPYDFPDLLTGEYNLTIKKEGYASITKDIIIEENKAITVFEKLFYGCLVNVTSEPIGSEVWIDGDKIGNTPMVAQLTRGEHTFEFKNVEFYQDIKFPVTITSDRQPINIKLTPKYSRLIIHSHPQLALYNIYSTQKKNSNTETNNSIFEMQDQNGILFTDNTNDTIRRIQQGNYLIQLNRSGYRQLTSEIIVNQPVNFYKFTLVPLKFRKKGPAIIYSTFFPGAGQSYLKRGSPSLLNGFLFYGGVFAFVNLHNKAANSYDKYLEYGSINEKYRTEYEKYKNYSQICMYSAAGLWAINMIWTLAMPAEEKRFRKLGLVYNSDNPCNRLEMGLCYKF